MRRRFAALLLLVALAAPAAWAADPPQAPILRIEAGGHTGTIPRLAVDGVGRLLATAGYDKTVRLWALRDGRQVAVLRPPIGVREEGEIYAVAITPDGRRVFAAGATGGAWDGTFSIYMFDAEKAALIGLLPGLPAPVNDLAVSPDGSRFAAGLASRGIRVWDAADGHKLFEDEGYAGPVRSIAFDGQNRLFATSADGHVRGYDASGRKLADAAPRPGLRPWGLAVSPDGDLLAVTYENADRQGGLHLDVLAAGTLAPVFAPSTAGLGGEGLLAAAWTADGRGGVQLLAGGYARAAGGNVIRRWRDFGLGAPVDLPAARDTIRSIQPLPGGGAVYAAEDPGWGAIAPDGRISSSPSPPMVDLRPAREQRLAVSADGTVVEFAAGGAILRFDAAARVLATADRPGTNLAAPVVSAPGTSLAGWRDTSEPRLNGVPLALERNEIARSVAVLPGGQGVLLGTDTHLRLFGRDGRPLGAVATPAAAWAVTVGADGRIALAALLDGTLRWYGLAPGAPPAERAALFVHADRQHWVLVTPEGFFDDGDRGGDALIGVHLNRARNQQPEWISFSQAYRAFYAPSVVQARLRGDPGPAQQHAAELGDLRTRLMRLPAVELTDACAQGPGSDCGRVELGRATRSIVAPEATRLRLGIRVTDRGLGIGYLDVFVNDRNAGRYAPPDTGSTVVDVPLDAGTNAVTVRAYDGSGTIFSETPPLIVGSPASDQARRDRLYVLAIGIDRFVSRDVPQLHYAVADATGFVEAVRRAAAPLYRSIEVTLLANENATRARIMAAFDAVAQQVRSNDAFVLYVATHGERSSLNGHFLLIPNDESDVRSAAAMARDAIDEGALVAALARIKAKNALLFLDTCHAGTLTVDSLANIGHETGRYLLAAASPLQEALDSYDNRNGVLVYAVREGLAGRAAMDPDGTVSALALGEYVSRRVGQLAREKRYEQDAEFKTAEHQLRSFPIGKLDSPPP